MKLTDADFKKIIARRDPRYDGRFHFGVKTTKIYCRPVCPARPKPENILIFRSSTEAENSGYRPCLRCHPDAAPGSKLLLGTANTVARALRLIDEASGDDELDVDQLAGKCGLTSRHLRRLFDEHLGASPIEVMITKRLHLAKQLLIETQQAVTEIAYASGFQSVRRFNEAFKKLYHRAPSEFRRSKVEGEGWVLRLPVRRPYDWTTVLNYLRRHEAFGIEQVSADSYRRYLPVGNGKFGTITVTEALKEDELHVRLDDIPLAEVRGCLSRLKVLFDTEHNPRHLPRPSNGIRVPGAFDVFEIAVSIILSQLISTAAAKQKLRQLIVKHGRVLGPDVYAFPSPAQLRTARLEELGMPRAKAGAIRALAAVDPSAWSFESLLALPGIGPWTAAMIDMRCLGNSDAFPQRDLIVARALEARVVEPSDWNSSRAYLTHVLWRDHGGLK